MKMPIGNLPAVIAEFFSSAVLPAASAAGGAAPFATAFIGGLIARRAPAMIEGYLPLLKSLGAVDEQNRIDVDLLYGEAAKNLEAHPFSIGPYKPDKGDLDALREIMNRHGE
jgi:hypothetical protein